MRTVSGAGPHDNVPPTASTIQLITLAVYSLHGRPNGQLVRAALRALSGVQAVELDPSSARVWVFGNGTVDPESLQHALAVWGHASDVLEEQVTTPA